MGNYSSGYQHPSTAYIGRELESKQAFVVRPSTFGPGRICYDDRPGQYWLPGTRVLGLRVTKEGYLVALLQEHEVLIETLGQWRLIED